MKVDYPAWVCRDCGLKASGGKQYEWSTWHYGQCGVCGKRKPVTEPRDFFYPEFETVHFSKRTKPVIDGIIKKVL